MISDASAYFCAVQQNLQTRKDEEPTELITALVNHHHHDNKTKKKKKRSNPSNCSPTKKKSFLWAKFWMRGGEKKEKPARPHNWSSFLKEFLSPVSMGRTPAEQLQRQAMAPHERFCLEAGRRTTWSWRKSIVFPLKGKKPRRSCTMVCGTYQNIWQTSALWKNLRPPFFFSSHHRPVTLPSGPLTGPCHCLGPESSKRAL